MALAGAEQRLVSVDRPAVSVKIERAFAESAVLYTGAQKSVLYRFGFFLWQRTLLPITDNDMSRT